MVISFFTQSEYSLLNNTISINKLIKKAKEYDYEYLTIADDDNMYGAFKFYSGCVKNGIKPIIGIHLTIEAISKASTKILLYAKTNEGYKNLLKLASAVAINGIVSFELLKKYHKGLIAISPIETELWDYLLSNKVGEASNLIDLYNQIFDDFLLGLAPQNFTFEIVAESLVDLAFKKNIDMLPIDKASYLDKSDEDGYRYLKAIKTNKLEYELDGDYHFKNKKELEYEFKEYSYVFDVTKQIVKDINLKIEKVNVLLPVYDNKKGINSKDYLLNLSIFGLKKRLEGKIIKKYYERLVYELDVINKMGYDDYFLIVYDYVLFAKKHGILVGPGRGSAAGSLVSYSLGITNIDPIKYGLLFERFLNPERVSMPDIDIDFPDDKRDEVIQYVKEKYGKNHVAHIGTFGTFQAKLAIRDVARVMNIDSYKVEEVLKYIPRDFNLNNYLDDDRLVALSSDLEIDNLLKISKKIYGLPKNTSTHAAGIVLSKDELTNTTPLTNGIDDLYQTEYTADDLEQLGLLKMDFLGLRNLKMINSIQELIRKNENFDINKIPLDDKKTYELLSSGETDGIFQFESAGIKNVLRKLKPTNFEDIIASLALYRPGPMNNINEYIERKNGKKFEYFIASLEDILKNTYGIIVYQEQIMLIAQKFASYSLGEADILRRAVSKKKHDILEEERKKFVEKSVKNGYDCVLGNKIYDYIVKFSDYGFNRSHSASYAMISYQMAYLKAHYMEYFLMILLDGVVGDQEKTLNYIKEAYKRDIKILPPDINLSYDKYTYDNGIRIPLIIIKNVGNAICNEILQERKKGLFRSLIDFKSRVNVPDKISELLVYAGCFDFLNQSKRQLMESVIENKLFSLVEDELKKNESEYSQEILEKMENEALGFNLKYNPLVPYKKYMKEENLLDIAQINNSLVDKKILVCGKIIKNKNIFTKKNLEMAFLSITNGIIDIDGVIFPEEYKKLKTKIKIGVFVFEASVKKRNDKLSIVIDNMKEAIL